jgi:hypothetical protein
MYRCPKCDPPDDVQPWPHMSPYELMECTAHKPLLMVVPPEGAHISCPVHPEGHHISGPPQVIC